MPDVLLFLEAFLASAGASTIAVLAFALCRRQQNGLAESNRNWPAANVLSAAAGMYVGCWVLRVPWKWPPMNAMDRFRELILPVTVAIELLACWKIVPESIVWILRCSAMVILAGVLLFGSVYFARDAETLISWQTWLILLISTLSLIVVWLPLLRLSVKRAATSIGIAVAMCIQAAGVAIMLAGYVNGGAAAIPLASAVLATTVTTLLVSGTANLRGVISVAVIALFSLLFIGRFFGALSTAQGVVIFFSPLLCALTELPAIRHLKPLQIAIIRIVLVAIPLLIVLVLSKLQFDHRMAPLLSQNDGAISADRVQ